MTGRLVQSMEARTLLHKDVDRLLVALWARIAGNMQQRRSVLSRLRSEGACNYFVPLSVPLPLAFEVDPAESWAAQPRHGQWVSR